MAIEHGDDAGNMGRRRGWNVDKLTTNQGKTSLRKVTDAADFEIAGDLIPTWKGDSDIMDSLFLFQLIGISESCYLCHGCLIRANVGCACDRGR